MEVCLHVHFVFIFTLFLLGHVELNDFSGRKQIKFVLCFDVFQVNSQLISNVCTDALSAEKVMAAYVFLVALSLD